MPEAAAYCFQDFITDLELITSVERDQAEMIRKISRRMKLLIGADEKFLTPEEWDYWYDGKPAAVDIKDPYGTLMEKKGTTRDGGAIWDRMGNIACWNTVMDEDRYLTRRWNEFVSS